MDVHISSRKARHLSFSSTNTSALAAARKAVGKDAADGGNGSGAGPAVSITGRQGHGNEINGIYFANSSGEVLNDRNVYRHSDPLSFEYGDDAGGKHLALWFGGKDDVWAISVEAGSADVIAYVNGDILSKPRADEGGEDWIAGEWQVSDGEGQYISDAGVIAVWVTSTEALESAAAGGVAAANLEDLLLDADLDVATHGGGGGGGDRSRFGSGGGDSSNEEDSVFRTPTAAAAAAVAVPLPLPHGVLPPIPTAGSKEQGGGAAAAAGGDSRAKYAPAEPQQPPGSAAAAPADAAADQDGSDGDGGGGGSSSGGKKASKLKKGTASGSGFFLNLIYFIFSVCARKVKDTMLDGGSIPHHGALLSSLGVARSENPCMLIIVRNFDDDVILHIFM